MKSPWSTVPAVPAVIILCTGIAVSYMVTGLSATMIWVIAGISALLTILSVIFVRRPMVSLACLALGLGVYLGFSSRPVFPPEGLIDTYGSAECTVRTVKQTDLSTRLIVDVTSWTPKRDSTLSLSVNFGALCTYNGFNSRIVPGTKLRINTKLTSTKPKGDIPYQIEYNRFLYIDNVTARMYAYDDDVEIISTDVSTLREAANDIRRVWLGAVCDAGFDEQTTRFMLAVLGGDTLLLDEDTENDFRRAGLSHVLAISGMHVGIVMTVIMVLLYPIKLPRRLRRVYFACVAVAVWFFAIGAGMSSSVCRAATMCSILMVARALETHINPYQSLSVAVFVILLFFPLWLFMPGFQFSVCAVLAIVTFVPRLDFVPRRYRILRLAWLTVIIPPIAVMGTAALTIFYFHSFPVDFWLSNIAAAVLVPMIVALGFVAALLSLFGLSAVPFARICDTLYEWISDTTSSLSGLLSDEPIPVFLDTLHAVALAAAVVALGVLIWHFSIRRLAVVTVMCGVLVTFAFSDDSADGLPRSEVYIPRHTSSTDIIIVHNRKAYAWTSKPLTPIQDPVVYIEHQYGDFFRHRGVSDSIVRIGDGFSSDGIKCSGSTLTVNGLRIGRIDNDSSLVGAGHLDAAIVTEAYNGNIKTMLGNVDADSIILSSAIHFHRAAKFGRQLDSLNIAWRHLRDRAFVRHCD